jgi:hypothetical protein
VTPERERPQEKVPQPARLKPTAPAELEKEKQSVQPEETQRVRQPARLKPTAPAKPEKGKQSVQPGEKQKVPTEEQDQEEHKPWWRRF